MGGTTKVDTKATRLAGYARAMRRAPTQAERQLWRGVKKRLPLQGTHFRRQVVIDGCIADLCCHAARLVVEVDGATHSTEEERRHDAWRERYLEARGYRVLRFQNAEIYRLLDGVIETIWLAVAERLGRDPLAPGSAVTPTPDPSPQGGGGTAGVAAEGRAENFPP